MYIQALRLYQFRNYARADLSPARGVTVLFGANAQGKTNVIEAIHLCCLGRSHRTNRDTDLIRLGETMARAAVTVGRRDGPRDVSVEIGGEERKKVIKINGAQAARIGELMGCVNAVLFSPEDLRLVKDGPDGRRRFLDMEISQVAPQYFYALQRYARALAQRNGLLRRLSQNPKDTAAETLDDWDAQLCEAGAQIIDRRATYIRTLGDAAEAVHAAISGGRETLRLAYAGQATEGGALPALLRAARAEDFRRATTTVGPHRDDARILLDGRDARAYASQGQQRTAALSLKLAEIEVMRKTIGEPPILLLDDVMSELDVDRRKMLLARIGDVQTVITCTHLDDLGGAGYDAKVEVRGGVLG